LCFGADTSSARSVLAAACTALQDAVRRNDLPVLSALLAGGAPAAGSARYADSVEAPLHAALRLGHLRAAVALLRAGASLLAEDASGRCALDAAAERAGGPHRLASPDVLARSGGGTEAISWGAATNFALGQACARAVAPVGRVDALLGQRCTAVSAARFHSAAVTADGALLTWGWGRGGRTGHADAASGAVMLPRVLALPGLRGRVVAVACAKHHTLACTDAGDVFAWGCNRDGRLGVPGCDTAATPRRVNSLVGRARIVALAAANRHSVALAADGAVFTWGSNAFGQLGYGTPPGAGAAGISGASDGAAASTAQQPRAVELRGGAFAVSVSAAKRHTLVATRGGDALQWGHTRVNPRRVALPPPDDDDEVGRTGFVRAEGARHRVISVAAGATASCALTAEGRVLAWRSDDESLRAVALPLPAPRRPAVAVAAAKRRVAAVDADGSVFVFEWGAPPQEAPRGAHATSGLAMPEAVRVPGARRVVALALAEAHGLALTAVTPPPDSPCTPAVPDAAPAATPARHRRRRADDEGDDMQFDCFGPGGGSSSDEDANAVAQVARQRVLPTLKALCEDALACRAAESARHALPLLEAADALGAPRLRAHCAALALANLDAVLAAPGGVDELCALHPPLLAELEEESLLLSDASGARGARAASLARDAGGAAARARAGTASALLQRLQRLTVIESSGAAAGGCGASGDDADADDVAEDAAERALLLRTLRRKLTAVEALEAKHARGGGAPLDAAQRAKLARRDGLSAAVAALERGDVAGAARAEAQADAAAAAARAALEMEEAAQRSGTRGARQRALSSSPATAPPSTPMSATAASASPAAAPSSGSGGAKPTSRRGLPPPISSASSSAPQRRSGLVSLSLFLSGALDEPVPPEPELPAASSAGAAPSWRASSDVSSPVPSLSLRDVQNQQRSAAFAPGRGLDFTAAASRAPAVTPQPRAVPVSSAGTSPSGAVRVPLSALLPRVSSASGASAKPRRWDAGGAPASPSLRDIQAQQADDASKRRGAAASASPLPPQRSRGIITVTGFALPSASSGSPAGPPGPPDSARSSGGGDDRWYVPDAQRPLAVPLRDILQAEAEAAAEAAEAAAAVAAVAAAIAAEEKEKDSRRRDKPQRRASTGDGGRSGRARGGARPTPRPQRAQP
jgi:alpha-tubulin suppressor-like RCC1 family protein